MAVAKDIIKVLYLAFISMLYYLKTYTYHRYIIRRVNKQDTLNGGLEIVVRSQGSSIPPKKVVIFNVHEWPGILEIRSKERAGLTKPGTGSEARCVHHWSNLCLIVLKQHSHLHAWFCASWIISIPILKLGSHSMLVVEQLNSHTV